MELIIAGIYCIGILAMIVWMTQIKRLADILFPLPKNDVSRPRGHAERLSEAINQAYCSTGERACQDRRGNRL